MHVTKINRNHGCERKQGRVHGRFEGMKGNEEMM